MTNIDLSHKAPFKLALMLVTIAPTRAKAEVAFELACYCATLLPEEEQEEVKRELEALSFDEYAAVMDGLQSSVELSCILSSMPVGEA